jgi:hypothetical protein
VAVLERLAVGVERVVELLGHPVGVADGLGRKRAVALAVGE